MSSIAKRLVPLLAALTLVGAVAPSTFAADPKPPKDQVIFVSREQLEASGQIVNDSPFDAPTVSPAAGCLVNCYYLRNVRFAVQNKPFVTFVQGNGPQTLSLRLTSTTSNGWTASGGITSGAVSVGVGFSVTWSGSVSYSSSTIVASGTCRRISAYNVFNDYTYDVWVQPFIGADYKVGSGRAWKFMGVEYWITVC